MIKNFKKVLVANRGEIAIRIFRACYDLGLRTVAVYSKEDMGSLFRTKADESYLIGENKTPLGAYLDIDLIMQLAKAKGVDAIHPGYGFLSENADLARACEREGIAFIGPPSDVLDQMGNKLSAKVVAESAGVPTIPGSSHPLISAQEAIELAEQFGYPVILKAAAGGGGRGMRLVHNGDEIISAFPLVKAEALKAFGSADVFIEKYIVEPKHIEVQILGDNQGNIVHLFERDCSVQRRYQKVVEFAPSLALSEDLRKRICEDAVKIAKSVGYVNAGTVEFLVDHQGNHYFIEMNPRIQVEHTVTEEITGIDIVQTQILIAEGHALDSPAISIRQQDVKANGFAIQCRVTTEDPRNDFAPDHGQITAYRSGGGFGVRLDAGNAFTGAEISPYYDSLLVKITTADRTFEGAVRKARRSLNEIRVRGVQTNIAFLLNVLNHPTFMAGQCDTRFIDHTPELFDIEPSQDRGTKVLKYIGELIVNDENGKQYIHDIIKERIPTGYESTPPDGLKQLLESGGVSAVMDYIKNEQRLLITDTTLRDAHQSLLSTRMRTHDMFRIAEPTAHILKNCFSFEMWGGATYDVSYRFLHESPWERLDVLREKVPNVLFQMLLRGANAVGYESYPDNVVKAFIRESARRGIDVFRVFDSLNWLPNMELALEQVAASGKIAQAAICYAGNIDDPKRDKYPLQYYVDLAKQLQKRGAHMIAIKDMSGLLRPYAAKRLITALKNEIDVPIQLHTHDTSGNQIAAYLMAQESGVDIVDCAISSLASFTSQPALNSLLSAMEGHPRRPDIDDRQLQKLSDYWADIRPHYAKFEAGMIYPDADIYRLEIPGGQYSNLRPQVASMGLLHRFDEVKDNYERVNEILGDIVKVTPSSKMVGDLAIFMTQNNLTPQNIVSEGERLTFPDSVVAYFRGMMGQPQGGFPKDLQRVVLKGEAPISVRPGSLLADADFESIKNGLPEHHNHTEDILSAAMYPKVFEDYLKHRSEYGDLSRMPTPVFLYGMRPGDSTEMEIEDGKTLAIKYIGLGETHSDHTVDVIFELNAIRRTVRIKQDALESAAIASTTPMADAGNTAHVAASMPGMVTEIQVHIGQRVEENQPLVIVEAMKMETAITARHGGVVKRIHIEKGDLIKSGQLLMEID